MTTTFETAKVGDRVWNIDKGWGLVVKVVDGDNYPIKVRFDTGCSGTFTKSGKESIEDSNQRLFWGVVEIKAPSKPPPHLELDTKVFVWNGERNMCVAAHFSHFTDNGEIACFREGRTSFTTIRYYEVWDNFEVVNDK